MPPTRGGCGAGELQREGSWHRLGAMANAGGCLGSVGPGSALSSARFCGKHMVETAMSKSIHGWSLLSRFGNPSMVEDGGGE